MVFSSTLGCGASARALVLTPPALGSPRRSAIASAKCTRETVGAVEVGERAGDAQHAGVAARREPHGVGGLAKQLEPGGVGRDCFPEKQSREPYRMLGAEFCSTLLP